MQSCAQLMTSSRKGCQYKQVLQLDIGRKYLGMATSMYLVPRLPEHTIYINFIYECCEPGL